VNAAEPGLGIEAIAVHVPRHYLELTTLARANDVDPAKYRDGLGGRRMAIAAPGEDAVTLGFEAAAALLERYAVAPERIGLLLVGTESGVDGAKPIASYLHRLLGLRPDCRTFDTKHACYSGTAALRMAADWFAVRGRTSGRRALVVATDIARYSVGSAGEPTQGAGAVAMLIGDRPACFRFDPHPEAVYTEEVMDFWRPHYRQAAVVDGRTSIDSYLRALSHTWSEYARSSGLGWDDYDHLLFHAPFPKMATKAYRVLAERFAPAAAAAEAQFEQRTGQALWANRELGNCYSGSLYLGLAGLLERHAERSAGARVGLFSYGSGCCAEFFSGRVGADPAAWRDRIGISAGLLRRRELSYERYLCFRRSGEEMAREGSCGEGLGGAAGGQRLAFRGIRDHRRVYAPVAPPLPLAARSSSARAQIGK
jgi:hydroxymethylglutaryl-CoA synthase